MSLIWGGGGEAWKRPAVATPTPVVAPPVGILHPCLLCQPAQTSEISAHLGQLDKKGGQCSPAWSAFSALPRSPADDELALFQQPAWSFMLAMCMAVAAAVQATPLGENGRRGQVPWGLV